jgi:hypothetical protein
MNPAGLHRVSKRAIAGALFVQLARPAGFEPATSGLEIHRSIP